MDGNDSKKLTHSIVGATLFFLGFGLSAYVFTVVQILNSYPFHPSLYFEMFGDRFVTVVYSPTTTQVIFGGYLLFKNFPLTYTQTLEIGVLLAFIGLFIWKASSLGKVNAGAVLSAFGFTMLVIGALGVSLVYTEIHILWGELWLGFTVWKFWSGFPGGGGYPWGAERVAYNTCFIKASDFSEMTPNCIFLNYNDVLYISILMVVIGFILWRHYVRRGIEYTNKEI